MTDDPNAIRIDLGPLVRIGIAIATEPYEQFIARLLTEGRLTNSEAEALAAVVKDRSDRLAELMKDRLGGGLLDVTQRPA